MDDDLPTEYDVIVIGTGLVESVVAAASSRIGKKVLHLDSNSYYGHLWATFTLENFEQWLNKKAITEKCKVNSEDKECGQYDTSEDGRSLHNFQWKWFVPDVEASKECEVVSDTDSEAVNKDERLWTLIEMKKFSNKFNIDLSPKIIFSKGPMVDLLIRSKVSRYTEFISVHNVLLYLNSVIESVPYSKSDVFSTRSVSVVEKRILMKLLQDIQNFNEELLENEQYKKQTFYEFLRSFEIPENIENYILYSIARVSKSSPCIEGIKSSQSFLNSLGIYGNSPFLWPLYGSSELVQAFCRLCAVFGGIYCLNRGADKILVDNDKCMGILSENKKLLAQYVVMSSSQAPADFFVESKSQTISRAILITNKTLFPTGKKGASSLQFPSADPSALPVTIIELDSSTLACPNDLYIVHMIKEDSGNDYKEFDSVVEELFEPCIDRKVVISKNNEMHSKPCVLFKLYFSITQLHPEPAVIPKNFYLCSGPVHFELDFYSALQEAENIFKKMFPDEDFLPTPEELTTED